MRIWSGLFLLVFSGLAVDFCRFMWFLGLSSAVTFCPHFSLFCGHLDLIFNDLRFDFFCGLWQVCCQFCDVVGLRTCRQFCNGFSAVAFGCFFCAFFACFGRHFDLTFNALRCGFFCGLVGSRRRVVLLCCFVYLLEAYLIRLSLPISWYLIVCGMWTFWAVLWWFSAIRLRAAF